jgi:transglutaminase-like putative cysteine protease
LLEIPAGPYEIKMIRIIKYFLIPLLILCSCNGKHLISDRKYSGEVHKAYLERKELAKNRSSELFSVLKSDTLSTEQKEALEFLLAYMPLSDLADYSGEFFLNNADRALRARREVSWGKRIPDDVFLHYVLPCRVNNENLDSFRILYYDEIHNRIKGMNLKEAALEINYWCHEKVTYQPADIRTSAPMSTILSARGRCGEESTFTVAALRTAGIPARQVYTPRWAHTDDNHAWVEVWIDGEWYYMGACEPEAVFDRGWFTEPARRAMLVHTKSFGAPSGKENVIISTRNYSEVNNLSKYARTKKIYIKVTGNDGLPVENAIVEYKLYNYAEFYTLAAVPTDAKGLSSFETGFGDLLIWAHKGDKYNFEKINVSNTDTLSLRLSDPEASYSVELDLNVPGIPEPYKGPDEKLIQKNAERIKNGNQIRQAYIDSWMPAEKASEISLKLKCDTARLKRIFSCSMGNYLQIASFLEKVPDSLRSLAVNLLEIIAEKDLRDTKCAILTDHLIYSIPFSGKTPEEKSFYVTYILNPRVANENMVAWRKYLSDNLAPLFNQDAVKDPEIIVKYINDSIRIDNADNYYSTPLTPCGVYNLKVSDSWSRAIFFVAVCRTFGIPSRLEPGSNIPQYYQEGKWKDVYFSDQHEPDNEKGFVKLVSSQLNPVPEYYIHFTLARFENGVFKTLEYDYNKKISDFREELELPAGHYMLVTGNRISTTRILSEIRFFDLLTGEHKTINVNIRKEAIPIKIIGKLDVKSLASHFSASKEIIENARKNGIIIAWIEPDQEPTKHVFNELPFFRNEFEKWGGYFLFLSSSELASGTFNPGKISGLPKNSFFGNDSGLEIFRNCVSLYDQPEIRMPLILYCDKYGNIKYCSEGYMIGIGEQIIRNIR